MTEEKSKEQEIAQEQLNAILNQTRPKNLGEGLKSGVGNIVTGAVGAVGIAVLAPVAGASRGAQQGGVIGGAVGLVGGAVVGVVGAAVVAVSGVVSGVTQMGRGVAAVPKSISEPRKGKWWDENQGKWIETNLETEAELLSNVPADDEDILGDARAEDVEKTDVVSEGKVFESYYYDVLEVDPAADESKIRRQYYRLAKKYHPDKVGKDDKEAANKFKEVAEAYQVLSDEKLRHVYNNKGREGLNATRTSVAVGVPKLDPAILFAFLFGSDKFHDYIGNLAMSTSASIDDPTKISAQQSRTLQQRRCARLAISLAERLNDWTNDQYDLAEQHWSNQAKELVQASYGLQLLHVIGQVYSLAAVQFLGSLDSGIGMPSISKWAKGQSAQLKKKSGKQHDNLNILKAGMKVAEAQVKAQEAIENADTPEEKENIQTQAEEEVGDLMLNVIWTTTVVDITATLHETCQMVLFDKSIKKEIKKKRGLALKKLGEIFQETKAPEGADEKTAKEMYEEAALAAMLDTVAKKEQAAYNASIHHA